VKDWVKLVSQAIAAAYSQDGNCDSACFFVPEIVACSCFHPFY
jgi:hypothetical protein